MRSLFFARVYLETPFLLADRSLIATM
jgi:hypothetical protein